MPDSQIQRALGELLAEVRNINKKQDDADRSRKAIYASIDETRRDIHALKSEQISLRATVADTKAVTDDVKRWKAMGMGALAVVGIGSAGIGAAIVKALEWASSLPKGH